MLIQDSFIKRKEGDILTMNPYDLCLKEVFSNKQHFADLLSSVYFKKDLLLDPDKLSLYDKETHHDLGFRKENDLLMFYDDMFFLHLEFQRKKDPYMPVRILNYKYAGIHQQIKTNTKLHLLYPVYSLTLYMGESKWEHRKSLYECIHKNDWNKDEIPDYEMKMFDINSDPIDFMCLYLQKFFRIIQYVYQKKWENLYTDSLLENVEEDIFYHANVFVNLNQEFIQKHTKEGVISMCKALEEYAQECYELVKQLKLENIIFTGRVDIVKYMEKLDFTILTSISEGQPLSVLESFAARRPCVTTDVGCCRELLEGKEEDVYGKAGYYVAPMYRDGLALAMEKMCESRRRRLRMGKNGQERVKAYYRQERMIRLYRELYEEVIQKNGRNRI